MLKLGMNSMNRGFEVGKYLAVGGGTTTNPSEKSNWWYGLKTGSGVTSLGFGSETLKGGMSSNYWLGLACIGDRFWQPTVNIKSPYIPQLLGVADAVEETEVEVFKVLVGYGEMGVVELDAVGDDVFFEDDPVEWGTCVDDEFNALEVVGTWGVDEYLVELKAGVVEETECLIEDEVTFP